ncbi:MAG: DUF1501 domain-containing protein [Pedosphaera sp.]|nr:DUF1501 domain-containing protein [Pedosphaera sp.]MSU43770.1 DUF1501 domain-containing protein [Pedosphaera sp.]
MLTIQGGQSGKYCDGLSRRSFLQIGSLAMGGIALPQLLQAEAAAGASAQRQKAIIMVYLPGGPSHTDMYDIKEDAPKEYRGDFSAIDTNVRGIRICEHFPRVARMFDKFVAIRSTVGQFEDHNPFDCMTGRTRQRPMPAGGWPSIGAVMGKLQGGGLHGTPAYIDLNGQAVGPGFLGTPYKAFAPSGEGRTDLSLNGITVDRLEDRKGLLKSFDQMRRDVDNSRKMDGFDAFNQQAFGVMTSTRLLDALDLKKEDPKVLERYKTNGDVVQSFCTARRLVEAGARFVSLAWGGWDTHGNNFGQLKNQLPQLDTGLSALVGDLADRSMLNDVTVVVWGEFGRTPRVNAGAGRDHWPRVMGTLMAGGGMKTGQVVGATDREGGEANDRPVHIQEIFATMYRNIGINVNTVAIPDLNGRPQFLVDGGRQPLAELV